MYKRQILDGEIGQSVLKEFDRYGVKALAWGEGGFRHLVTKEKEVRFPQDFKGLKIRCMETESYIATYGALGTNAVPMAWSETITGLQQGTLDAVSYTHLSSARSTRWAFPPYVWRPSAPS